MDHFSALLAQAAQAADTATAACRAWEGGCDVDSVSDTAWDADGASLEALEAVAGLDPALIRGNYPESRVGRLAMAARLLVLAGTDEGGTSQDLEMAAQILRTASKA